MVVAEERAEVDSQSVSGRELITLVSAPLEDVMDCAETSDERGLHLGSKLLNWASPLFIGNVLEQSQPCYFQITTSSDKIKINSVVNPP